MTKPLGIKIIAWSWIGLGSLLAFLSIVGMLADVAVRASAVPGVSESPNIRLITFLLENVSVLAILLFVVAVASISAGIALHQLKAWGRMIVEVQSVLVVVCAVGFTVYWLYAWTSFVSQTHDEVFLRHVFDLMGGAAYVFAVALLVLLFIPIVWYLRGKTIRAAFSSHKTAE